MTTQNERLRALLDEAREALTSYPQESEDVCRLLERIDAALAESPSPVERENASLDVMWQEMVRECDAARAEIERLRKVMDERWYECHDGSEESCCKNH